MNNLIIKENINIENLIYEIHGKQVMLDSDLAVLYSVETKRINEAVKNNLEKFPERFAFRIEEFEYDTMMSKKLISKEKNNKYIELKSKISTSKGGSRKGHTVFTEQGVYMLTTILKSKNATKMTIIIMDTFVAMKKYISYNLLEQKYINDTLIKHESDIKSLQVAFNKFKNEEKNNHIFFEGQIYDAYSKITDILKKSKKKLIIIDSYADKTILDIISEIKVDIILIIGNSSKLKKIDIEKYNKQYNNLKIIYNNTFHDRYYIINNKKVYHSGTSINNAGSKTFSINLLTDKIVICELIKKVESIMDSY